MICVFDHVIRSLTHLEEKDRGTVTREILNRNIENNRYLENLMHHTNEKFDETIYDPKSHPTGVFRKQSVTKCWNVKFEKISYCYFTFLTEALGTIFISKAMHLLQFKHSKTLTHKEIIHLCKILLVDKEKCDLMVGDIKERSDK